MTLTLCPVGVENPANLARIRDAAHLLDASCSRTVTGRLIAVENVVGARDIYGRSPLREDATLAVGNERRGLPRTTLAAADEIVQIPTASRTVTTLNVAAAAAVAAWFVVRGSGAQARVARPAGRRPALLIVGEDHVEVGSSFRSAAAFGFTDVLLDDRGAGWFAGPASAKREARAAARRHKNRLRVHSAAAADAFRYREAVLVTPSGPGEPIHRVRLSHGNAQVVVIGARPDEMRGVGSGRLRIATLGLRPNGYEPQRLVASIVMAEIARQVGRRHPVKGAAPRRSRYERGLSLAPGGDVTFIDHADLLMY